MRSADEAFSSAHFPLNRIGCSGTQRKNDTDVPLRDALDDGSRWRRGGPWPSSLLYAVYQQSVLVIVRKTMLGFQLLSLDLIFPNGILAA